MVDVKDLRENPEKYRKATKEKQLDPKLVDDFLKLDEKWRKKLVQVEKLRQERNVLSKKHDKGTIEKAKKLKKDLQKLETELKDIEEKVSGVVGKIPNLIHDSVAVGKDESDNKPIRKWGEIPKFDFKPKDHLELGEKLGLIDVKKASKITGARFAYLMADAALVEYALVQYAFNVLSDKEILKKIADGVGGNVSNKPFIPVVPPVMIDPEVFDKMARRYPEEERYYIPSDDLFLVGSAEHTLGPLHMDETFEESSLPVRYVGFSTAFRREAGSSGKDTRGILRVHQFDKVEMETFCLPENTIKEQDFIVGIQEYLMQSLKLPYQVVNICTGDMGGPDYRQVDIETWLPGQGKYRETHTSDNMTDYQSRRLNTKVRRKNKETQLVHMNDATVFAIGRMVIAILENYQQKDGSVKVPEVLQKYMGKKVIKS